MIFQVCFCSSLIGTYTRQSLRSIVTLCESGDNDYVLLQSHLTSPLVGEQKSNTKDQQAPNISNKMRG
ncbi:hypothetical protein PNC201_04350 [Pseudoalteromonas sp. NC201]|nr:hypothetical protein PNC201_04350 [Pseudoalteromonas sp. NC201]